MSVSTWARGVSEGEDGGWVWEKVKVELACAAVLLVQEIARNFYANLYIHYTYIYQSLAYF